MLLSLHLTDQRLPVHVTEIHHFPDSRIADIFNQLAVDKTLELHVAGEAQVRAIEPRQLGKEMLESADSSDELFVDETLRIRQARSRGGDEGCRTLSGLQ